MFRVPGNGTPADSYVLSSGTVRVCGASLKQGIEDAASRVSGGNSMLNMIKKLQKHKNILLYTLLWDRCFPSETEQERRNDVMTRGSESQQNKRGSLIEGDL